jgi:predicted AlkP superfamily pyrophosphatase or phosphodiesterase
MKDQRTLMSFTLKATAYATLGAWLLAITAAEPCRSEGSGTIPTAEQRCVILVSLDGFAQFYVDDPLTYMPTLRRMMREGAVADQGMECSFPTVTWPNHTTLVTGVPPARHGVLANMVFDRDKGEPVQLLVDPVFDKDEIVKVPTIYDVAHQAGLRTASIVWPATRNAKSLDWTVPDMKSPLFEKSATPGWLDELAKQGIPVDRYGPWVDAKEGGPRRDWIATREVVSLLERKERPNLILLHLIELDHAQHESGPRGGDARWAVSTMDDRIRDLRDAIEQAGLEGITTLVVTSDHGFFATENSIFLNSALRDLGLVTVADGKVVSKDAWSVSQGGASAVYVIPRERRAEIVQRIRQALDGKEGIEGVFTSPNDFQRLGQATSSEDRFGADLWVAAKEGYSFSNDATRNEFVRKDAKLVGTHGFLPSHPEMRGIFVAWGQGIKPGSKLGLIQNTQVAPTIARLLNLEMLTAQDKPLIGALHQAGETER